MAKSNYPPKTASESWFPPVALDAKRWINYAKTSLFFAFPACLLAGAYLMLTRSIASGIVLILLSVLSILLILLNDTLLLKAARKGKFGMMGQRLKIFSLLGLCCLVFPGVLYLIAYGYLKEMFRPQTQRYPSGYNETLRTYPSEFSEMQSKEDIYEPQEK